MSLTMIATVVEMIESLPEPAQNQVVERLRAYVADLQDELQWGVLFQTTQPQLAPARRARQEIASRQTPTDGEQTRLAADFWQPKTLEQLLQLQDVKPVTDIACLTASFWPADESADDVIAYIYHQRQADRLGEQ